MWPGDKHVFMYSVRTELVVDGVSGLGRGGWDLSTNCGELGEVGVRCSNEELGGHVKELGESGNEFRSHAHHDSHVYRSVPTHTSNSSPRARPHSKASREVMNCSIAASIVLFLCFPWIAGEGLYPWLPSGVGKEIVAGAAGSGSSGDRRALAQQDHGLDGVGHPHHPTVYAIFVAYAVVRSSMNTNMDALILEICGQDKDIWGKARVVSGWEQRLGHGCP